MASVRRYEKHARLLKMLSRLSETQRSSATQAAKDIGARLLARKK
jgi:HJR/Mrr/RecB family endonuclease